MLLLSFFCSSSSRHTRCALVTGVQTCALPIFGGMETRIPSRVPSRLIRCSGPPRNGVRVPPKSLSMGVAPLGAGSEGRTITAISGSSCVRGGTCSVARPGWRRCLRGRPLGRRLGRHLAPPSRRNSRLPAHAPRQRRHCHCPVCEYRPSRHEWPERRRGFCLCPDRKRQRLKSVG